MATYPQWLPGQEPDIVGAALEHLKSAVPEAVFRPGSPEVTYLEALAVLLGDVIRRYQEAPAATARHLMGLLGVERHPGVPAHGKARFHVSTGAPTVTIPAGTVLRYTEGEGEALEFVTTQELVRVTTESTVGEVEIRATAPGASHNGVTTGAPLATVDYLLAVERVEVSEDTRAGEDPETDAAFDARARAVLSRMNSTLVHASEVRDAAVAVPGVGRAVVLDRYDPGTGTQGAVGHVSVAVTDTTGLPLPTDAREALQRGLAGQMLSSLVVHVIDPTYTDVDAGATVEVAPGWDYFDVETGVRAALERFLDPLVWPWWSQITAYDLVSAVDDVPGVARVVSVTGVTTLPGPAPLPRLGQVSVRVSGGGA